MIFRFQAVRPVESPVEVAPYYTYNAHWEICANDMNEKELLYGAENRHYRATTISPCDLSNIGESK